MILLYKVADSSKTEERMKIILVGYGQMGRAIEQEALMQGHTIVAHYDLTQRPFVEERELPEADLCIEFTQPDAAYANCLHALEMGYPVVCGTTGWNDGVEELRRLTPEKGWTFFHASNFSVGVNILYVLNKRLAELMNHTEGYRPEVAEVHHINKKDAPSGTAIKLAKAIVEESKYAHDWVFQRSDVNLNVGFDDSNVVPVSADRVGDVAGIHRITYKSAIDRITIEHEAFNREGLAKGVLLAANYALSHKGVLRMETLLGLDEIID